MTDNDRTAQLERACSYLRRIPACLLYTSLQRLAYELRNLRRWHAKVFQNPDDQLVATLVEDDVAFGPENLGVPSAQIAQLVREALKGVGLVDVYKRQARYHAGMRLRYEQARSS